MVCIGFFKNNVKTVEPTFQDADHSSDEYPEDETDHASQGSLYTL